MEGNQWPRPVMSGNFESRVFILWESILFQSQGLQYMLRKSLGEWIGDTIGELGCAEPQISRKLQCLLKLFALYLVADTLGYNATTTALQQCFWLCWSFGICKLLAQSNEKRWKLKGCAVIVVVVVNIVVVVVDINIVVVVINIVIAFNIVVAIAAAAAAASARSNRLRG